MRSRAGVLSGLGGEWQRSPAQTTEGRFQWVNSLGQFSRLSKDLLLHIYFGKGMRSTDCHHGPLAVFIHRFLFSESVLLKMSVLSTGCQLEALGEAKEGLAADRQPL